ncbi:MAG: cyclic peptide export ABC transporter [Elainellaceae cyanobacterium]
MNLIRLLLSYSRTHVVIAISMGVLSGASAAGIIALINYSLGWNGLSPTTLFWMFACLCTLRLVTNLASQVLLIRLSQDAVLDLRMLLSKRILASPLRHLEEVGAHRLLAALTEDIQAVSDIAIILPFVLINLFILIGCQIYLIWLSPTVFLVCLGFLLLGVLSYQVPSLKALSLLKQAREQEDRLFHHFRAVIQGTKELKLHHQRRQAFLTEELQASAQIHRTYNVQGNAIYAAAASWGQVLFFVCVGLLLFTLPTQQTFNVAIVSSYALTIIYVMTPLEYIMRMLPSLTKAAVALRKIESLGLSLDAEERAVSENGLLPAAQIPTYPEVRWTRLDLIEVTHTYYRERGEGDFTLGPINLSIYPGELIFIVGGNGSGKSTLAKLITGLYTPESGAIYFDDTRIDDHNRDWYRHQFSAVFSDFYLFERLLGIDNTRLEHQIQTYLVQLQLDHKVRIKNGKLSTTDLSQGQRKRLALLTAYLEDRPIYLFDEWAADQDPIFKKIFYTQLLPELKQRGKSLLVISHDDQYFRLADRIIKLEYGTLRCEQVPIEVKQ